MMVERGGKLTIAHQSLDVEVLTSADLGAKAAGMGITVAVAALP